MFKKRKEISCDLILNFLRMNQYQPLTYLHPLKNTERLTANVSKKTSATFDYITNINQF